MPDEKFSDLAHRIRRYQDDFAKQAKELSELRSELARLKQITIFERYDVPNTGQNSKLRGWRQLSENHFIRGDGRVHIITHLASMTVFWDDLPREFW
jgi:hypothetical protein